MTTDELRDAIREHAYLEGDFVLRSGRRSSYYLDKYRFETRPDLLAAIAARMADQVAEHEPEAARLAGPSSEPSLWSRPPRSCQACRF
jgi:orotate phosphoribosyltransferase